MTRELVPAAQFKRAAKKLHANQKADLDKAIEAIVGNPDIGTAKTANLTGVLVYKFRMSGQLTLLAYEYDEKSIYLVDFGSHQNFYRDLKRR